MRAILAGLVVVAGCQSGLAVEDWAEARRDWQCEYYAQCGLFRDFATCKGTNLGVRYHDPWLIDGVKKGRIWWDDDGASRCLARRVSCDLTSTDHWWRCDPFTEGTLHDGETCSIGSECLSKECWIEESCRGLCCKGVCVGDTPPVRGRIGDVCRFTACLEGYCNGSVCSERLAAGSPCDQADACAEGLYCVRDVAGMGQCTPLPATGEPCTTTCAHAGDRCTARGICERGRLDGDPCLQDNDCSRLYVCGPEMRCVDPGVATGEDCSRYGRCASFDAYCDSYTLRCERTTKPSDEPPSCTDY